MYVSLALSVFCSVFVDSQIVQVAPNSTGIGSRRCAFCDVGKYATGGNYSGFANTKCEFCQAGTYKSKESDSACTICSGSMNSSAGSVSIDACTCSAGRTIFEGETACQICPRGMIGENQSMCAYCDVGTYWQDDYTCQMCPRGKIGEYPNICAFCHVGMYWQDNYTCKNCTMYGTRYQTQLHLERTKLFPGIIQNDTDAVAAFHILPSQYDANLCAACECSIFHDSLPNTTLDNCSKTGNNLRRYLDATTRQCETCPNHKRIVRHSSQRSCIDYNVTHTSMEFREWNDESQIYECIAGYSSTYAINTWTSHPSCQACEVGKYKSLKSMDSCTQCPLQTLTISTGAISVQECMYCATDHRVTYHVSNRSSLSMLVEYVKCLMQGARQ